MTIEELVKIECIGNIEKLRAKRKNGEITILQSKRSEADKDFVPCIIGGGTRPKVAAAIGLTSQKQNMLSKLDIDALLATKPDFFVELSVGRDAVAHIAYLRELIHIPIGCSPTYVIFAPNNTTKKTK